MQLNAKSAVSFSSFVVYENNLYNSIDGGTNFLHQLIAGRYAESFVYQKLNIYCCKKNYLKV